MYVQMRQWMHAFLRASLYMYKCVIVHMHLLRAYLLTHLYCVGSCVSACQMQNGHDASQQGRQISDAHVGRGDEEKKHVTRFGSALAQI